LAVLSLDYLEKLHFIESEKKKNAIYLSAGVCMPFYYYAGEFHIQLIKRSASVSQPGDLSFPGGMLNPVQDHFIKYLLISGLLPALKKNNELRLSERDRDTRQLMTLFLASAVREVWEEVRLNPFNIIFLGSLPTYNLKMFRRIIFPSVCFVSRKSRFQMNDEVESLLHIPLSYFFDSSHYHFLRVEIPNTVSRQEEFPSLLFKDKTGQEHILWGATFFVIMRFLDIVYHFKMPSIPQGRLIYKTLLPTYNHVV
ncbi:MAG: CoA pyrophosphatase, partial [Syntrophaceae bacterium]|nr:CoA pyrophosphatase [Syntrophaceae bacterium]